MTFESYARQWQETLVTRKPATQATFRSVLAAHLLPAFGEVELAEISNPRSRLFVNALAEKYSPKTVSNIWKVMAAILGEACRDDLVIKVPEPRLPSVRTHDQPYFTLAEMRAVDAAAPPAVQPLVGLLAETGLRLGEVQGLEVGDLDFIRLTVRVARSVFRGQVQLTKTAASDRLLSLSPPLAERLYRQTAGRASGFLFPSIHGGAEWPSSWARKLEAVEEAVHLAPRGFHAWRRGNASLMVSLGIDERIAAKRLGHAYTTLTARYAQNKFDDREAAFKLGQALFD